MPSSLPGIPRPLRTGIGEAQTGGTAHPPGPPIGDRHFRTCGLQPPPVVQVGAALRQFVQRLLKPLECNDIIGEIAK